MSGVTFTDPATPIITNPATGQPMAIDPTSPVITERTADGDRHHPQAQVERRVAVAERRVLNSTYPPQPGVDAGGPVLIDPAPAIDPQTGRVEPVPYGAGEVDVLTGRPVVIDPQTGLREDRSRQGGADVVQVPSPPPVPTPDPHPPASVIMVDGVETPVVTAELPMAAGGVTPKPDR